MKGLIREEFNDALAFLSTGVMMLYEELGMGEVLGREVMVNMITLLRNYMKRGWSREELVVEFLVERSGIPREGAEKIIERDRLIGTESTRRQGSLYI